MSYYEQIIDVFVNVSNLHLVHKQFLHASIFQHNKFYSILEPAIEVH